MHGSFKRLLLVKQDTFSCQYPAVPFPFSLLLYFGERILHVISITFMLNGIAMKEMTPYRIRTQTSIPWRLSFRSLFLLTLCSCCRGFFFFLRATSGVLFWVGVFGVVVVGFFSP